MSQPPEHHLAVMAPDDLTLGIEPYLDHLDGMTPPARAQVIVEAHRMLERLVREIQRVEFAERHDQLDEPEITATMVIIAVKSQQPASPHLQSPRPSGLVALHAMNLASVAVAGIMTGYLHSTWQWTVFATATAFSITTSSYIYRRRWQ